MKKTYACSCKSVGTRFSVLACYPLVNSPLKYYAHTYLLQRRWLQWPITMDVDRAYANWHSRVSVGEKIVIIWQASTKCGSMLKIGEFLSKFSLPRSIIRIQTRIVFWSNSRHENAKSWRLGVYKFFFLSTRKLNTATSALYISNVFSSLLSRFFAVSTGKPVPRSWNPH